MQKLRKKLLIAFSCLCVGATSLATACQIPEIGENLFAQGSGLFDRGPKFLEGAYKEVTIGESILINEFVEFGDEKDYKFTITAPNGKEKDFSSRPMWIPEELGTHKMTYTINSGLNKGTAIYEVTVVAYEIEWSFNNNQSITLQRGQPIVFDNLLYNTLNTTVTSYCDYEVKMISVTVDGKKTEFTDETSYTPESLSDHVFRFRVTTEDGQSREATVIVHIQYVDEYMESWLAENNVSVYQYLQLSKSANGNRYALLNSGLMTGKAAAVGSTDMPYISYNGEYGEGDYVMFDFTGSNLPQLAFFVKESTPDLVDGEDGIYLNNGFGSTATSEALRHTIYGPWKIGDGVFGGGEYRLNVETSSKMGENNLDVNANYRYIAGVQSVANDYTSATLHLLLINLDTGNVVRDREVLLDLSKYELTADYFSGNIVAYGCLGETRAWSNINPVFENVASIYDLVKSAKFVKNCANTVMAGATLNTSDYITPDGDNYSFYYTDVNGVKTEITTETFSFESAGTYRLYYEINDGETIKNSIEITVVDMDSGAWNWLVKNNAVLYKTTLKEDFSAIAQTATLVGKASKVNSTDMPYLAFRGDYGVGDYVTFDFTGSNLPQLVFFADDITNDLVDGKNGIYINNGMLAGMTTDATRRTIYGPWKIKDGVFGGGAYRFKVTENNSPLGQSNLDENTKYRYIAGIEEVANDYTSFTIRLLLVNLDTGSIVYDDATTIDVSNYSLTEDYFKGSIVAYGNFEYDRVWDRVYEVERNVTNVYELLNFAEFKSTANLTVKTGANLKVSDYIDTTAMNYSFYYTDVNGTITEITSETFSFAAAGEYTLYYLKNDGDTLTGTVTINVLDMDDAAWAWLETNKVKVYGATEITSSQGVSLKAGSYTGKDNTVMGVSDVPYVAFTTTDGTGFGLGDTLAFDFTGNNLPFISFFNEELGAQTKNFIGSKGLIFSPGICNPSGYMNSIGESFRLFGGTKFEQNVWSNNYLKAWTAANTSDYAVTSNANGKEKSVLTMSYWGLQSETYKNTKFRCIVSFTSVTDLTDADQWQLGLTLLLIDLDSDTEVFKISTKLKIAKTKLGDTFASAEDFKGNIVLYGRPYQTTNLDKIYPIFKGKSPNVVKMELSAQ